MTINKYVLDTVSLEFSAVARKKAHSGSELLSLGLGEPGFPTPDNIIKAANESMLNGETRYSSPWGIPELLSKIRSKVESERIRISSNGLIITLGAKQALSLSLTSILEKEDEVILISPSFVSFKPQILMAEPTAKIKEISLEKTSLTLNFKELKKAITLKTKAIIVNFPNNPTGAVLPKKDVEKLIELAKKNNIYIISDEIYSSMAFKNSGFTSFLNYIGVYNNIFIINGFSKAYSMTGWRIGYLIGPPKHIKRVSILQQHLNTNIPVFIQRGAEAALCMPDDFTNNYKDHLYKNSIELKTKISQSKTLTSPSVKGGMFAIINISHIGDDSDSFCTQLLKHTNVAATPGVIFSKKWDDHVRVSLGGNQDEFKEAIKRLIDFADYKINTR